ncbi:hypothetical protein [Vibrio cholerae]|uniref:hypothetical protein n=1 Tax=Vibrio phage ICP2_2013_A_Haiti TaxID=1529058 RepID=UPI0004E5DE5A|nr:hypothetical protein [Vibrio cholerae]YP_009056225.1 hypothetical protein LD36_gp13 [Vibrio phage ICP2_2013_A_Haiti]AII27127.1 hypothetical protein ICP22013AHaiti_13 [Vibrio phage ICP2_2013_A_Haiti]
MADLQHQNIPDEYLHEVKGAVNAPVNTFLRAKGDGTTEFVELTNESFKSFINIPIDPSGRTVVYTPVVGRQYVFTLSKSVGSSSEYQNDVLDCRGAIIPVGTDYMLSVGGRIKYVAGQFSVVADDCVILKVSEIQ